MQRVVRTWLLAEHKHCIYAFIAADPCKTNNGGCDHICEPLGGSKLKCSCRTGYKLNGTTECISKYQSVKSTTCIWLSLSENFTVPCNVTYYLNMLKAEIKMVNSPLLFCNKRMFYLFFYLLY